MIKLIVKLCLVFNQYICLPPIEVIPRDQSEITSITACMMGGAIFTVERNDAQYYAKVYCTQSPEDFEKWMKKAKTY